MKKITYLLIVLQGIFCLYSCQNDAVEDESITEERLIVDYDSYEQQIASGLDEVYKMLTDGQSQKAIFEKSMEEFEGKASFDFEDFESERKAFEIMIAEYTPDQMYDELVSRGSITDTMVPYLKEFDLLTASNDPDILTVNIINFRNRIEVEEGLTVEERSKILMAATMTKAMVDYTHEVLQRTVTCQAICLYNARQWLLIISGYQYFQCFEIAFLWFQCPSGNFNVGNIYLSCILECEPPVICTDCPPGYVFDGANCYSGLSIPVGYDGFIYKNAVYVEPNCCTVCPNGSEWDGANCYFGLHFPEGYEGFIWNNAFYVNENCNISTTNGCCPDGFEFDGANCYSGVHFPEGYDGFVYNNSFYVEPSCDESNVSNCCPEGWPYDGANCYSGFHFPENWEPFIWNGGFYLKPKCL